MIYGQLIRLLARPVILSSPVRLYHPPLLPTTGSILTSHHDPFTIPSRGAKRKGTRIKRAMEAKKRSLQRKSQPQPEKKRRIRVEKSISKLLVLRYNDLDKPLPPKDDVYFINEYRRSSYSLQDVITMHRETHHPTIYSEPDALLEARLEVFMKLKRKTKYFDPFSSTLTMPFPFELERRSRIIAVAKTVEEQEAAKAAGAILAGGVDIIKNIKTGLVSSSDYDHLVCHTDMLVPLTDVRGLLGENFPSKAKGNFGNDIVALVKKFKEGYDYKCKKNEVEPDFGYIDLPIGRLNMETDQLAANILALIKDSEKYRPSDAPGQFPQRLWLSCPPSIEKFMVKFWELDDGYVDIYAPEESKEDDSSKSVKQVAESASTKNATAPSPTT